MNLPSTSGEAQEQLAAWRKVLREMTQRTRNALKPLLDAPMPGDTRSRRLVPRGPDVDVPRTLTVDDDIAWIDHRSVAQSAHLPFALALQSGMLRTIPARQDVLGECVTLTDLSMSMLSGAYGAIDTASMQSPVNNKIAAMLAGAACANALAEGSGFALRSVCIRQGGRITDVLRAQRPNGFALRVLDQSERHLIELFRGAHLRADEPHTTLRQGLQHVIREVRGKGVVIIISDFLEGHESFRNALQEVMARHKVVLLDVASPRDRSFPESEAGPDLFTFGARHLEDGLFERANTSYHIKEWNAKVRANSARIDALLHGRARRVLLSGRTFQDISRTVRSALLTVS